MLRELQQRFAAAVIADDDGALADDVSALRGIAIHRATVRASLTETLAKAFPVVRRIVGEAFFDRMAGTFIAAAPPRVPQLSRYGEGFADFIAAFAPARALPYLADVARLEWARAEAYFAADAALLGPAVLRDVGAERVGALRLALHPATRLVRAGFPIARIWEVNQPDVADIPAIDMGVAESAIVTRPGAQIAMRRIDGADAAFVAAISAGATYAEAAARGYAANGAFDLRANLLAHLANGTFSAVVDHRPSPA